MRLPTGESVAGEAEGHNLAYAFVRDVFRGRPSGPWTATFTSESNPPGAVRVHSLPNQGPGAPGPGTLVAAGAVRTTPWSTGSPCPC